MHTINDVDIKLVSLGIVALNEEELLPALLSCVKAQDFPHDRIEVLLVDGGSSDATRSIMQDFADSMSESGEFYRVMVLDNPKKIQAAGWNRVFDTALGDAIIRVDAHALLSDDFVSRNVTVLESGEYVCGGYRPTVMPDVYRSLWHDTLHLAEESAFGSSFAKYRREMKSSYVDSVFHGAYRRDVVSKVGSFDERLLRTEDNDYHYRIRKCGYRIRFDPSIRSSQIMRTSLGKMLRQKYQNGYWVGRTLFVQPGCISKFHLAPLLFVLGIVVMALIGVFATWIPFVVCAVAYALLCIGLAIRTVFGSKEANATAVGLPFIFCGMHVCYGVGSVVGIIVGTVKKLFRQHG